MKRSNRRVTAAPNTAYGGDAECGCVGLSGYAIANPTYENDERENFMRYRRAFVAGAVYFFTLVTDKRRPILASEAAVNVLREAFRVVKAKHPFEINAMVVLPDHLHCIWTLPPDDADFATRWRLIKTWFSKHCDPSLRGTANASQKQRGELPIWQHRYWEHLIRDENDFVRHVDYIHYNPVKHGYVNTAGDWLYSSFSRFVAAEVYPADWGQTELNFDGVGHE